MVYEFTNGFNISASIGVNNTNSPNSKSENSNSKSGIPAQNILTVTPSAPPYPGSEAEFIAEKRKNVPYNSYNIYFYNDKASTNPTNAPAPYWKCNPIYEKQAKKMELMEGALSIGLIILIFCIGAVFTNRLHKQAAKKRESLFNS